MGYLFYVDGYTLEEGRAKRLGSPPLTSNQLLKRGSSECKICVRMRVRVRVWVRVKEEYGSRLQSSGCASNPPWQRERERQ